MTIACDYQNIVIVQATDYKLVVIISLVKEFKVSASGASTIKLFTAVICEFLQ
jgi:hypothetical protein